MTSTSRRKSWANLCMVEVLIGFLYKTVYNFEKPAFNIFKRIPCIDEILFGKPFGILFDECIYVAIEFHLFRLV